MQRTNYLLKEEFILNLCKLIINPIFIFYSLLFIVIPLSSFAYSDRISSLSPVPFHRVEITGGLWKSRQNIIRDITIPHEFRKCEETGRISNFAKAAGIEDGEFRGYRFNDSDVYKLIEGAAYSLRLQPNMGLEGYMGEIINKIISAQWDDGYLFTYYSVPEKQPEKRWENIGSQHQLYCAGHLIEAAIAYYEATGKRKLLDAAISFADHIDSLFGLEGIRYPPGHEEIEIALIKLFRVTKDKKYLKLAQFFLDERGYPHERKLYGKYAQDHKPVEKQRKAAGHAVRATYLYSAMADVAALTGRSDYIKAINAIWEDVVGGKLYITGGIGVYGHGEGFWKEYDLPNRRAYCETCASIGNAMWNHRLFLLHKDAKYLDVFERILYNALLSGISLSGDRFFYTNPLKSYGEYSRSPWFGCACCPPNIVRFINKIGKYIYAKDKNHLYVNLFIENKASIELGNCQVQLNQETSYPWKGKVKISVDTDNPVEFSLFIRIPGWTRNRAVPSNLYRFMEKKEREVMLSINKKEIPLKVEKGFVNIHREWNSGDVIELELPMPIRRVIANENVKANTGKVAIQRGPVVYCAEGIDNDGYIRNLVLPDKTELKSQERNDLLGGVTIINGKGCGLKKKKGGDIIKKEQEIKLIPYYVWANRGNREMSVWIARRTEEAMPLPLPTIASRSRISASEGTHGTSAVSDQLKPKTSNDHSVPNLHWWPHKGTREWVQYDFEEDKEVSRVEVYWFDDTGEGECRVPESWRVFYLKEGRWEPVPNPDIYTVNKDEYNQVNFDPIRTNALKIEVRLKSEYSGGVLEWKVE